MNQKVGSRYLSGLQISEINTAQLGDKENDCLIIRLYVLAREDEYATNKIVFIFFIETEIVDINEKGEDEGYIEATTRELYRLPFPTSARTRKEIIRESIKRFEQEVKETPIGVMDWIF
jgi:hypothetical protein